MKPLARFYAVRNRSTGRFLANKPRSQHAYTGCLGDDFTCCPRMFTEHRYADKAAEHCYKRYENEDFEVVPLFVVMDKPVIRKPVEMAT